MRSVLPPRTNWMRRCRRAWRGFRVEWAGWLLTARWSHSFTPLRSEKRLNMRHPSASSTSVARKTSLSSARHVLSKAEEGAPVLAARTGPRGRSRAWSVRAL